MKKILILIPLFFAVSLSGYTQEIQPLSLTGKIMTSNRLRYNDHFNWNWNENRIELMLEKKFSNKARFHTEAWFRSWGFPSTSNIRFLSDPGNLDPTNFSLREAYVNVYGFIFKNLDVTFGRQRIAWGTADRLNPTDNLNPYDLEDIWDFGRHLGSESLRLKYYLSSKWQLEGVFIPFFRPALFPRGDMAQVYFQSSNFNIPSTYNYLGTNFNVNINSITDSTSMPRTDLSNSIAGIKLITHQFNFDFSASYLYGRFDLPYPYQTNISLSSLSLSPPEVGFDLKAYLLYPRLHVFGFDFAGAIGSVGVWGEAAVFIPDSQIWMRNNYIGFPQGTEIPTTDSLILDNKPYLKFVLGTDYTFSDNSYLNFQFLHGFANEAGRNKLNDYFMFSYSKKFLNEKLEVKPVNGAILISDWKNIGNNYALIFMPEFIFSPNDNTSLLIGLRMIDGKGDTPFARLWDKDETYFEFRYMF